MVLFYQTPANKIKARLFSWNKRTAGTESLTRGDAVLV